MDEEQENEALSLPENMGWKWTCSEWSVGEPCAQLELFLPDVAADPFF